MIALALKKVCRIRHRASPCQNELLSLPSLFFTTPSPSLSLAGHDQHRKARKARHQHRRSAARDSTMTFCWGAHRKYLRALQECGLRLNHTLLGHVCGVAAGQTHYDLKVEIWCGRCKLPSPQMINRQDMGKLTVCRCTTRPKAIERYGLIWYPAKCKPWDSLAQTLSHIPMSTDSGHSYGSGSSQEATGANVDAMVMTKAMNLAAKKGKNHPDHACPSNSCMLWCHSAKWSTRIRWIYTPPCPRPSPSPRPHGVSQLQVGQEP